MSEALFNTIVDWLQAVCAATGLTYSEINILIYCGFMPATWGSIVCLRQRRWWGLLALHLLIPALYYVKRRPLVEFSRQFYDANILALNRLGEATGLGYVGISLVIGIGIPIFIWVTLFLIPKRWLLSCYVGMMVGNLGWYFWVLRNFW